MKQIFIAEIKTRSPSNYVSPHPWRELFNIANRYGDWLSIHTHEQWNGSIDMVKKARSLTKKKILAKGIHESDDMVREALSAGADYVLVMGRIPDENLLEQCLLEPRSFTQLKEWKRCNVHIPYLVWNKRDLNTMDWKEEPFDDIRGYHRGWLCQASGIKTAPDVNPKADAFIVGEHLTDFVKTYR